MSKKAHFVDRDRLPADFPTHRHSSDFWEELGRAVATFGFLEQILKKAIFALTATRSYSLDQIEEAYCKWEKTLERTLVDTLGRLAKSYGNALRNHSQATAANFEVLIESLLRAADLRNVLCHGTWQSPSEDGRSLPLYVSNDLSVFETSMDVHYLRQIREGVVELACEIIDSVAGMGLQFPGAGGPGEPIL